LDPLFAVDQKANLNLYGKSGQPVNRLELTFGQLVNKSTHHA